MLACAMKQHRRTPALAVALIVYLCAGQGTANRLLSDGAPDAATARAPGSPALCANPITTYTVNSGDTPKKVATAAYPGSPVPWRKLWGLIKACNKAAASAAGSGDGKPRNPLLTAGAILSISAIPARLIEKYTDKPDDDTLKPEHPALQLLCGCTAEITVTGPSTWLDVVRNAYPEVQPAAFAANVLAMCNRGAKFVEGSDKKMLAADQKLRSICLTIKGKSFLDFLNEANLLAATVEAEMAASETSAAPDAAAAVVADTVETAAAAAAADGVSAAQTTCVINLGTSTAAVRPVYLSNSCPVYTNGCSGPSDVLAYQRQLTPCCQAHDWCYSCAHTKGWTGETGKARCDVIFRSNLYAACDLAYGSFDPNRALCKATADGMYAAVRLADQSYFTSDACPGQSRKLANTRYCFNPIYQLTNVVIIKAANGGQWGSWTNFARCPVGSWMNGFSARVQPAQGIFRDDTALNAVQASCSNGAGTQTVTGLIPPTGSGQTGDWSGYSTCPAGRHINAMRLQVEAPQGVAEDTAANTFEARCSDGITVLTHTSPGWGSWSDWVSCPVGRAVCAFRVKIEQPAVADPTALNDIELACCRR